MAMGREERLRRENEALRRELETCKARLAECLSEMVVQRAQMQRLEVALVKLANRWIGGAAAERVVLEALRTAPAAVDLWAVSFLLDHGRMPTARERDEFADNYRTGRMTTTAVESRRIVVRDGGEARDEIAA